MISFFNGLFDDEILYSIIARHHTYSGHLDYRDTIQDFFNNSDAVSTIEFPSRLNAFVHNFPADLNFTDDYLIQNHTLFPLYAPFLPRSRKHQIERKMKYTDGKGIKTQIGFVAGSICKKEWLMYCPSCIVEDEEKYGEAYFHRVHQVEGVIVCPKHNCILKNYPIKRNEVSRLKFIMLEPSVIKDYKCEFIDNTKLKMLNNIAISAEYLLDTPLDSTDTKWVHEKYRQLLSEKGFLTVGGYIKQRKLYRAFKDFYTDELLDTLESNINFESEYNWLKVALRGRNRVVHPIRNILLILFLCQDVRTFFEEELTLKKNKYYPCLNPVCVNYRKLSITKHTISYDYKAGENVITIYCNCGFIYSRKEKDNIFTLGRIKEFGGLWEARLKELVTKGEYSIRYIAKQMGCDPKTVVKYAEKIGIKHYLKTEMKLNYISNNKLRHTVDDDKYKEDILTEIRENPSITRQGIKEKLFKQYIWLYKYDKGWFDINMPARKGSHGNNNNMNVCWKERDNKLLEQLRAEYELLVQLNINKRITKSLLGKRLNVLSLFDNKLDKLPKTQKYLDEKLETVEDYQVRRVDKICTTMFNHGEELLKWKIVKKAGLRPDYKEKVDRAILLNISKYKRDKYIE